MITVYKFRIYPSKSQKKSIDKQLDYHRELYNQCLETKINAYNNGIKLSCFDLIKSETPKYKTLSNYSSLQQTVRRLDKSYQAFFKKNSKFPRFKGQNRFRTIQFGTYGDGCKLRNNKLYIQHVGEIKLKQHRLIVGKIKTLSITKSANQYYVNVFCEADTPNNLVGNKSIGIDFGVSSTITTSNGQIVKSDYIYKDKQKEIVKLQRKKNHKALQTVHRKIANKRQDFNHKLSRQIVDQYDIICLENLQVASIKTKIKPINKRLYDIGINQLQNYIKYKAESAGKIVVMVDSDFTTQTCFQCSKKNKLKLSQRKYKCSCGYSENRDINAAKNIMRLGLQSLGSIPRSP